MDKAAADSGGGPVTLLAHSAGGWLSRVFLLEVRPEFLPLQIMPLQTMQ